MENNLTRHFIRYGIIYALIQIVVSTATYIAGADFYVANMFLIGSIQAILFPIGYTIYSVIQFRKSNGGFMTLKEGFMVTFFLLAFGGLITTTFTIVLFNVVDKEYIPVVTEKSIARMTEVMESFGVPADEIEKKMEEAGDPAQQYTVSGQIKGYLMALFIFALYSVIIGAIFKREKPPFEGQQIT